MSNFKQVELTKEDYDAITAIGKDKQIRFNTPYGYCTDSDPKWDINIFNDPAEQSATHKPRVK